MNGEGKGGPLRNVRFGAIGVFVAFSTLLWVLPYLVQSSYVTHILILAAMYSLLGLSADLIIGHLGFLTFGHVAFFGIGAYTLAILTTSCQVPYPFAFLAAGLLSGALSILLGVASFRLSYHSFAIGTLGFAMIAQLVARNWIALTNGPMGLVRIPKAALQIPGLGEITAKSTTANWHLIFVFLIIVVFFIRRLLRARIGRAMHAIRENETLASTLGVFPLRYKLLTLFVGAMIAGFTGAYNASFLSVVAPDMFALEWTTIMLIVVFVGGEGSVRGIILGGICVAVVPELLRMVPSLRMVLYGLILLLMIVFRPDGIEGIVQTYMQNLPFSKKGHP